MTSVSGARHKKIRLVLAALLASGSTFAASVFVAGSASAESLRDAMASAYRYNPRLDAERARLRATDENVSQANSGYRPNISFNGDINRQNQRVKPRPAGSDGSETTSPRGYSFDLTQNVFNGFQTTNAVREAEALVRAGRESLRDIEQTVLLDAVTAYVDVVRDQAVVRLRENNVNVLSRDLAAFQDRFSVGEVTRTDVAQAQARRAASVSALDLARANLKGSRAAFERTIGHAPTNLIEPQPANKLLPKSLDEAINLGNQQSPLVVAALYNEQASRHTVDRIRGELLPQVQLEASYSDRWGTGAGDINESETSTVTGRMTVPIYEGGEVRSRIRQAKHAHVAQIQEIEQARAVVQADVVNAWSQLQAARAQLVSDQSQVDANRTALQGVREEEKVGQRTILDVLNAEQELLISEVQLVTTKRNLVVAAYALLATVGRLDSLTLGLTSEVYDPEENYLEVRRKWFGISITHGDGRPEFMDVWDQYTTSQQAPPSK